MKKNIILIITFILIFTVICANSVLIFASISSKPDKNGYYTITTSTKLKLTGKTTIILPISFSKNPITSKAFTKSSKAVSATITISGKALSITPKSKLTSNAKYTLKFTTKSKKKYIMLLTSETQKTTDKWNLVYHETFDQPFKEPKEWVEDTYADGSPYNADKFFGDNGNFFIAKRGTYFTDTLASFKSFRKSYTYGKDGWLTVELYGRDSNMDGSPEAGGTFINYEGKAKLISKNHTDAGIIRSTNKLPAKYKIEVTVSNVEFGGKKNDSWYYDGKYNGYDSADGAESSGPWDYGSATNENGIYFLCITDYDKPAPHNNIFIHHHRKFVIDTDNNNYGDDSKAWSTVWNPQLGRAVVDGSHYIGMLWLNGTSFGSDLTGNGGITYTPGGWSTGTMADKYLDNHAYTVSFERDGSSYTSTMTGEFYYGGQRTYTATRKFTDNPVIWHYNQAPEELKSAEYDQIKTYNGKSFHTWPKGSSYPEYFFFGDPHINYYEGSAEFDDVKLYLPTAIK